MYVYFCCRVQLASPLTQSFPLVYHPFVDVPTMVWQAMCCHSMSNARLKYVLEWAWIALIDG